MQSGFFYKDLEQVGVLLLVQKSVGYCRRCVVSVILCSGSEKRAVEYWKQNRTRISHELISPCLWQGGRIPFRAMTILRAVADYEKRNSRSL